MLTWWEIAYLDDTSFPLRFHALGAPQSSRTAAWGSIFRSFRRYSALHRDSTLSLHQDLSGILDLISPTLLRPPRRQHPRPPSSPSSSLQCPWRRLLQATRPQCGPSPRLSIQPTSLVGQTPPTPTIAGTASAARCSNNHVVAIQVSNQGLSSTLLLDVHNLTSLTNLELMNNHLSSPLPSLTGLVTLETLSLANNNFSSILKDFFFGLSSLTTIYLDSNPFAD